MSDWPETRESLILRVKNPRDEAAWREFVSVYRPVVYPMARGRGMQHADAEDLAQGVFASVAKAIEKWQPSNDRPHFRNWLGTRTWRYRLWDKGVVLDDLPLPKRKLPTEYTSLRWDEPISVTLQTSAPGAACMYSLGDAEPTVLPESAISDDWDEIHANQENLYFFYKGGYYGVGNDRWKNDDARKLFYDADMVAANFFVSELNASRTKYVVTKRLAPELVFNNIDYDGDAGKGPVAGFSPEMFDTISPAEALVHRDRVIGPEKIRFSIDASEPCVVLAKFSGKLAMVHVQKLDAETNTVTLRYKIAQSIEDQDSE